jgi:aminopeptidase YwaD
VSSKRKLKKLSKLNLENTLLLLDDKGIEKKEHKENLQYIHQNNPFRAGAVFMLSDKTPIWSASDCRKPREYVRGTIVRSALPDAAFISIRFSSQFLPRYNTSNVAGYVMGSQKPDSFIVFMAHYDHLGRMGEETMYPGANDNASGTATVLDLARHYSSLPEPPPYSIAFLLFSGEEAGLLGSFHFAENPLFPLSSIRFAVNLDMVGTGSEGLRAVNGSIHTEEFNILKTLNDECSCLPEVGGRGESANSDHYPFHAKGVKTFFIFTLGKEHRHYHVPADVIETLPFTGYNSLFKLLTGFADKLQHHE